MSYVVTNYEQLKMMINLLIQNCLKEIAKETEDYLRKFVEKNWYNAYSPTMYDRTYDLLNSITRTSVQTMGNSFNISIYFDTDKIKPDDRMGTLNLYLSDFWGTEWNAHMSFDKREFTSGLIETLEFGNPSPYSPSYAEQGISMLEKTTLWLKYELPNIAKRVFAKHGMNVSITAT